MHLVWLSTRSIDEVHMLSTAFNALLKTLEETDRKCGPYPKGRLSWHKIPATILSRVQRFEFKSS